MVTIGYMLFILGMIVSLYWQVRFLAVAYRRSLWWFFGCLFVPFVDLVFLFLNFKATWKPLGLAVGALMLAAVGARMAGVC
jgi:hypothetical protein